MSEPDIVRKIKVENEEQFLKWRDRLLLEVTKAGIRHSRFTFNKATDEVLYEGWKIKPPIKDGVIQEGKPRWPKLNMP